MTKWDIIILIGYSALMNKMKYRKGADYLWLPFQLKK